MTRLTFRKPGLVGFDASARGERGAARRLLHQQDGAVRPVCPAQCGVPAEPVRNQPEPSAVGAARAVVAGADIEAFVGTDSATNDADAFDRYDASPPRTSTALDVLADAD